MKVVRELAVFMNSGLVMSVYDQF